MTVLVVLLLILVGVLAACLRRARRLFDTLPVGIVVTDGDLNVIATNQSAKGMLAADRGACWVAFGCNAGSLDDCRDRCGLRGAMLGQEIRRPPFRTPSGIVAEPTAIPYSDGAMMVLQPGAPDRLLPADIQAAEAVHRRLMPGDFETFQLPHQAIAVDVCRRPFYLVGGDFHRVLSTPERVTVVVGDVAGKGVRAALVVSMVVAMLDEALAAHSAPSEVLAQVNQRLFAALGGGMDAMVTVTMVVIDGAANTYTRCRAGHEPALLWRSGRARWLESGGGPPLGLWPEVMLADVVLECRRGDRLFLYTDGLLELVKGQEDLLQRRLHDGVDRSSTEIVDELSAASVPRDDVLLVSVRID